MGAGNTPIQIQLTDSDGSPRLSIPGQATACPDLVIVPQFADGSYEGGFTLAHIPTGAILPTLDNDLTPTLAGHVAAMLAHLDWTNADRSDYSDATAHRTAWWAALSAASEEAATEDVEKLTSLIAMVEARPDVEVTDLEGKLREQDLIDGSARVDEPLCPDCFDRAVAEPPIRRTTLDTGAVGQPSQFSHPDGSLICTNKHGRISKPVEVAEYRYELTDAGMRVITDDVLTRP